MKFLRDAENFAGKVVIVRGSLNVPISKNGKIENDFRIKTILPTLNFLIKKKAKIILLGHRGRKKEVSLEVIFNYFKKQKKQKKYWQAFSQVLGLLYRDQPDHSKKFFNIFFDKNTFKNFNTEKVKKLQVKIANLKEGEILLLDNLRQSELEKKNDANFKQKIKSLGDVYVQEAFSNSHRQHSSMTIKPDFFGFQYEKEIKNLEKILNPENLSIFILGGSKIKTKLPFLEKILEKYDQVIVGGAIANTFYQHLGFDIKNSLVEKIEPEILEKILKHKNFILPEFKFVIWDKSCQKILDISPEFFENFKTNFQKAKVIFFNGPVGYYEGGFDKGTEKIIQLATSSPAFFILGGGHTTFAVFKLGLEKKVNFISTGGGALINFIINKVSFKN